MGVPWGGIYITGDGPVNRYSLSVKNRSTVRAAFELQRKIKRWSHYWDLTGSEEKEAKIDRQCVTHHSLCSQAPNSLKARSMETGEGRDGTEIKLFGSFIHVINDTLSTSMRVLIHNNIEHWNLTSPTTHTPSALVFHTMSKDGSLFDNDPWRPCAPHNNLGSNGSYILPIYI